MGRDMPRVCHDDSDMMIGRAFQTTPDQVNMSPSCQWQLPAHNTPKWCVFSSHCGDSAMITSNGCVPVKTLHVCWAQQLVGGGNRWRWGAGGDSNVPPLDLYVWPQLPCVGPFGTHAHAAEWHPSPWFFGPLCWVRGSDCQRLCHAQHQVCQQESGSRVRGAGQQRVWYMGAVTTGAWV
jgi:hypothetical protein